MSANAALKDPESRTAMPTAPKPGKNPLLHEAVIDNKVTSKRGILERLFTLAFSGFVYAQIWEDPEVDMEALKLDKTSRIMTISSGGCNVINYLTESPAAIYAIDLNPSHIALMNLKLTAIKYLPDYESFFRFFGCADDPKNIENYDRYISPHLDPVSKAYWEKWTLMTGRRINKFKKNIYRFGLLGRFISVVHILAKLYGQDPKELVTAKNMKEQAEIFDRTLGPVYDKKFIRFICNMPPALYGLGIPPSQFDELSESAGGDMAGLLKARLRRLACDFPIDTNYFAWQAFNRGYDRKNKKAIPRYLDEKYYDTLKANANNVHPHNITITGFLERQPEASLDCYVFLDAQDWMNDAQLNALWAEVLRTAAPGARVIFRTAGDESILEGRVSNDILKHFDYDPKSSPIAVAKDRSSIYGGFHLYTLKK